MAAEEVVREILDRLPLTGGNMATANIPTEYPTPYIPYYPTTAPEGTEWRYAGAAVDDGTITINHWDTVTPPVPDCKEAITILEEAEYELKELLKKTPATVNIGPKGPQDYIEIALRNVQAALRALLKI